MKGWVLALVVALAFALRAAPAAADVGVGISAQPVGTSGPARAGHTYHLSPVRVICTGTEPSSVGVVVGKISDRGGGREVPPAWVRLSPSSVVLQPHQQATVDVTLRVPQGARAGRYSSGVHAVARPLNAGAVAFGASAATRLAFTVTGPPSLLHRAGSWIGLGALVLAGLLILLLVLRFVFGIRFVITRPEPAPDPTAAMARAHAALAPVEERGSAVAAIADRARRLPGCEYIVGWPR